MQSVTRRRTRIDEFEMSLKSVEARVGYFCQVPTVLINKMLLEPTWLSVLSPHLLRISAWYQEFMRTKRLSRFPFKTFFHTVFKPLVPLWLSPDWQSTDEKAQPSLSVLQNVGLETALLIVGPYSFWRLLGWSHLHSKTWVQRYVEPAIYPTSSLLIAILLERKTGSKEGVSISPKSEIRVC